MPAFPGAASTRVTAGSCAKRQHSACSRPPPPTTRTFTPSPGCSAPEPDRHRDAAELLQEADVLLRLLRQIVELSSVAELLVPARQLLPHGLRMMELRLGRWDVVEQLSLRAVANADLDGLEPAQDVELGQHKLREPVESRGRPQDRPVEPAAPAFATGRRAELVSALAYALPVVIQCLGGEGPGADAGDVGL